MATNALISTGGLAPYAAKRSFKDTPEPAPAERKDARGPLLFVIQQHSARRMHFDFRLELDGVLKSWAIPKGLAIAPGDKRLAVMVEDHPFDYGSFEGVIPPKQYGAGPVIVWDCGVFRPTIRGSIPSKTAWKPSVGCAPSWQRGSSASFSWAAS